jgi:hypothetical protein
MLTKKLFPIIALVGIVLGAALPVVASATTLVFDSIDLTEPVLSDPIVNTPDGVGPIGASFSAPVGTKLVDVQLLLVAGDTPAGSVSVDLYSDNGGPGIGSLLGHLATIPDTSLTLNDVTLVDISSFAPIPLTSTRYWIVVSSSDSSAGWAFTDKQDGVGVINEYYQTAIATGVAPNTDYGPYQMRVFVPEPDTIALLFIGALGASFSHRRNSR